MTSCGNIMAMLQQLKNLQLIRLELLSNAENQESPSYVSLVCRLEPTASLTDGQTELWLLEHQVLSCVNLQ